MLNPFFCNPPGIVRVFLDSGAFQYNLDSVFTEALVPDMQSPPLLDMQSVYVAYGADYGWNMSLPSGYLT